MRKRTWGLDILAQPQYNITSFRCPANSYERIDGYEFGLNIGILVRKNFFRDFLSVYFCCSSGPHYVSDAPIRQADGFIFADNFFAGVNLKICNNIYLDLRPGFRHLSNAGLEVPNKGINNFIISAGIFVSFGESNLFRSRKESR